MHNLLYELIKGFLQFMFVYPQPQLCLAIIFLDFILDV